MVPEVVPASFPQSAVHQPSDHTFFVGIPAWSQHLADDRYTRDGYGRLKVVQCVDGLTAVDLQDLAALIDQGSDVEALTLRPRSDRPLDIAELEDMLNSTLVQREFASILSHYSPDGLAQKVFASTTFLKRLLAKFRQLRSQVGSDTITAIQNMLDAQSETTRSLLERFRDGVAPDKSWSTLIAITAVDDPFAQGSSFATRPEDASDEEEKDQSGDQGDGAQGRNTQGGKDNEVDLNHQDSGTSEPSSRKTTPNNKKGSRGSSRKISDQPQLRPSGWALFSDEARSPSNQLVFLELDVREIMKNEPVVWDTLRPDVILSMRAGIGYQGSIAMLSGDVMTYNLFPPSALIDMLASMMFWNRLYESFWTKYVPERYYLRAELLNADVRVAQEVMNDASSEHDDVQRDANYNPDDDTDIQDDDNVPDYAPNKTGGIQPLKQRFVLADVQALLATEPWVTMFENRVKRLTLHSYSALTPRTRMALDKYIRFMEKNVAGFWHGGHWFAIEASIQGGAAMQRERERQSDALARTVETKQRECVAEGVPSTIFWEAANWSLPSKPCYWILLN
ncbi:hypothetical protein PHMEG_00017203 [Phytophthora megakarya]|uniref:Uncharacterized protein n=1 Tax=Phytophthora megakarya TaxID=4795 RepID=A0A225VWV2_9STRA|nr:hypothetical protein PHMEG_00017203 [Phytophthora megakarya]